MSKNIFISFPSTMEFKETCLNQEEMTEDQTYKCIRYIFNNENDYNDKNFDSIYIFYTKKVNPMTEERKNNLSISVEAIMNRKVEIKYFELESDDFNDNFKLLVDIVTSSYDKDDRDQFYINAMSGTKNFKKFIYPIGYFYDNVHIIEPYYIKEENTYSHNVDIIDNNIEYELLKNINNKDNFENLIIDLVNKTNKDPNTTFTFRGIKNNQSPVEYLKNRSFLVNDDDQYKSVNLLVAIKKSINSYNYEYAYESLKKFCTNKDEKLINILRELYYDSINAYDAVNHFYHGYLCFDILLHNNQPLYAINEVENIMNTQFYQDKKTIIDVDLKQLTKLCFALLPFNNPIIDKEIINSIDRIIEEELKKISNKNDIRLNYQNDSNIFYYVKTLIKKKNDIILKKFGPAININNKNYEMRLILDKIATAKTINGIIDKKETIGNVFFKIYKLLINNRLCDYKDKLYALEMVIKKQTQISLSSPDHKDYYPKTKEFKKYLINNIYVTTLLKNYFLVYGIKSKKSNNTGKDFIRTRNYYLNILNDFREYDYLDLFTKINNTHLVYEEDICKYLKDNNITIDINDYFSNLFYNANEEKLSNAINRLKGIYKLKTAFRDIRNKYTHESQSLNIYEQDISKITKKYLKENHIENNDNSLFIFLKHIKDTYFNYYTLNDMDAVDYINDYIKKEMNNISFTFPENKIQESNNDKTCLISLLTDKDPYFYGCYSSALHIFLHKYLDNEPIDTVYYIVTKEYEELDDYKEHKERIIKEYQKIYDQVEVIFIPITKLKIIFKQDEFSKETTKDLIAYNTDNCFRICLTIYNRYIKNNYGKVVLNTTGGLAQFAIALSLIRFFADNIESYDCSNDFKYYYSCFEKSSNNTIPKMNNGTHKSSFPILVKIKESLSFTNQLEMNRESIDGFDFNSLYFNLGNSPLLFYGTKKAIKNLYNWSNNNNATLVDGQYVLNDELYINVLVNCNFYLKGQNFETAALLSGIIIEKIVKELYKVCYQNKLLDIELTPNMRFVYMDKELIKTMLNDIIETYKNPKYDLCYRMSHDSYLILNNKDKKINVLTTNFWFAMFNKALNNSKCENKLTQIGIENLVALFNLYWVRNSLIHREESVFKYDIKTSTQPIIEGFEAIDKILEVLGKKEKINRIIKKYNENIDIIRKEVSE